ncbi:hypothetical protein AMTRI_Chr04g183270 [Amborella trichopoda]
MESVALSSVTTVRFYPSLSSPSFRRWIPPSYKAPPLSPSYRRPLSLSYSFISYPSFYLFNLSPHPPSLSSIRSSPRCVSAVAEANREKTTTHGAKPLPFILSVAVGLVVRYLVPKPVEVTTQAWQLLSIFLSTITGLVLSPLPVGAWAFMGLTTAVITRTLSFSLAFEAFTNEVIWLIVISFFFARGFVKTRLGDRIANYFVKWLGKSTLGLSYGLTISEALIAPAMPSTTARAGGVFLPIIKSLSLSAGSEPGQPSSKKLGSYLVHESLGIPSVVAAMLGLSLLLLLGVLDWDDCLSEKSAWDTLAWFAVLVGMAGQLTNLGIVSWMSSCVAKSLQAFSLSWPAAFCVLQAAYFFIHYLFASQTGHVGALYSAFLAMHLASGVPGALAALALAYNTNLFGALTHFSSGQAAVYYGAGYVELPDVFRLGFITAMFNVLIWGVVGTFWWKFLGLY